MKIIVINILLFPLYSCDIVPGNQEPASQENILAFCETDTSLSAQGSGKQGFSQEECKSMKLQHEELCSKSVNQVNGKCLFYFRWKK